MTTYRYNLFLVSHTVNITVEDLPHHSDTSLEILNKADAINNVIPVTSTHSIWVNNLLVYNNKLYSICAIKLNKTTGIFETNAIDIGIVVTDSQIKNTILINKYYKHRSVFVVDYDTLSIM